MIKQNSYYFEALAGRDHSGGIDGKGDTAIYPAGPVSLILGFETESFGNFDKQLTVSHFIVPPLSGLSLQPIR
jgi:hypothetical protein